MTDEVAGEETGEEAVDPLNGCGLHLVRRGAH